MSKLFKFMGWVMIGLTALQFVPNPVDSFSPVLMGVISAALAIASFVGAKGVEEEEEEE